MKRFYIPLLFVVSLLVTFASCDDTPTYAEMLQDEKVSIQAFMKDNGFTVTSEYPDTIPFPDGVYFLTESGLYIHVLDTGSQIIDTIPKNSVITVRFIETNMDGDTTYSNMYGTSDPYELLYNNVQTTATYGDCKAWHEPLTYVGDGGHVNLIVPSKIGMSTYSNANDKLTSCFYDIWYSFWK